MIQPCLLVKLGRKSTLLFSMDKREKNIVSRNFWLKKNVRQSWLVSFWKIICMMKFKNAHSYFQNWILLCVGKRKIPIVGR